MKWYKNLYVGEGIKPKAKQIINRIKKNKPTIDVYVIALASNPENQLDIIPSMELLQKGYPTEQIRVIGLAKGKAEALQIVTSLVDEIYQKTGDVKVLDYLKNEWREQT